MDESSIFKILPYPDMISFLLAFGWPEAPLAVHMHPHCAHTNPQELSVDPSWSTWTLFFQGPSKNRVPVARLGLPKPHFGTNIVHLAVHMRPEMVSFLLAFGAA